MNTAVIHSEDKVVGYVICPYCRKKHKHGLGGKPTLEGQYRSADCHQGEYIIIKKNQ